MVRRSIDPLILYFVLSTLSASTTTLRVSAAEDTAPQTVKQDRAAEIEKLIAQLGSDDYTTRDAAYQKLLELGGGARPALERAAKKSSAEIAARIQKILADLPPLSHTIFDALGEPVAAAEVTVKIFRGRDKDATLHKTIEAVCDDDGRFALPELPSGEFSQIVEFRHPDYGISRLDFTSNPNPDELRFPIVRTGSEARRRAIEAVVTDPEGKPVAGAIVRCREVRTPGMGLINPEGRFGELVTDDAGRFSCYLPNKADRGERGKLIPANSSYHLQISVPNDSALFPTDVSLPNVAPQTIKLARATRFHRFQFESPAGGWITDPKDLRNVSISFTDATSKRSVGLERAAVTEGRRLVNGQYTAGAYLGNSSIRFDPITVTDDSPLLLDFHLPAAKVFRGRVVHGVTGEPLPGAFIMSIVSISRANLALMSADDWQKLPDIAADPKFNFQTEGPLRDDYGVQALVRAGGDGQFEITQPGEKRVFDLIAFAKDFVPFNVRVLELKAPATGAIGTGDYLLFPAAKIIVRPVHNGGDSLSVLPRWLLEDSDQPAWIDRFRKATDRSKRQFEYSHWLKLNESQPLYVPAGVRLRVKFDAPYNDAWAPTELEEPIQLEPGQTREIGDIHFGPAFKAVVRVVDENGQPAEGIPVHRLYDEGKDTIGSVAHNTDAKGEAHFNVNPWSFGRFEISELRSSKQAGAKKPSVKFDLADTPPTDPYEIKITAEQKRLLLEKPQSRLP